MSLRNGVLLVMLALFLMPSLSHALNIPALRWTERTDWVNVKTDVVPAAVGDGITDDTTAIQAALNMLADNVGYKAVYFPPGTYKITATVTAPKSYGNMIVGCGRDTRIVWYGAAGGIMLHSNGFSRARFVGIAWDGRDLAAVGVDHDALTGTYYETRVLHRHESFENFTATDYAHSPAEFKGAGIRVGHAQQIASAEMAFQNCLFKNNATGVTFLAANDYDNAFDGCEFQDNQYGIYCGTGNFYVRNSHFARSSTADVYTGSAHSNSLRRCTSTGSRQFFVQPGTSNMTEIAIQDCRIDSWTETTYGAIKLDAGGPSTIFDCTFTNPPNSNPPVRMGNGSYMNVAMITSNNVSTGTTAVVAPSATATVTDIPAGALGGCTTSASQSFLKQTVPAEGQVFDAKRDFGAVGNNSTDDTTALRNCIAAAKAAGNGAVAYIPCGTYKITGTLTIDGGNYSVSGSGFRTILHWTGASDGTAVSVVDPQRVRLEQFQVTTDVYTACRIRQTSATGGSSFIAYDGVYVGGSWLNPQTTWLRGLECDSLPEGAVVLLEHFDGTVDLINCSRARVLANIHIDGRLRVRGGTYAKTGFAGVQNRYCSGNDYDLFVRDNQDIIIADWYTEQTTHLASIEGNDCTTPGRVTVNMSKAHQYATDHYININNYTGRIFWGKANFFKATQTTCPIVHTGTRAVDLMFAGNGFYNFQPTFTLGSGATKYLLANVYRDYAVSPAVYGIVTDDPNPFNTTAAKDKIALALDDFAELGRMDLSLNYGDWAPRPTNLKLWLMADAGVTKDGSNQVSAWADYSGQANHASNPGNTEMPLLVANALNGKPVLRFDGSNDNFTLGSKYLFADSSKTGMSFIAVVKSTADKTDTLANLFDFGTPEAGLGGYVFHYDTNYTGAFWRKSGVADYGRASYTHGKGSNFVVYTGIIKFGAAGSAVNTVRLNGQQMSTGTSAYALTQLTASEIDESATRTWSSGPVSIAMQSKGIEATRNLQGDIAEILWYDSSFSGTDALEVERYLSKKWGVSLDGSADVLAPATVSDLAITGATDTTVTLSWTAPGDDAAIGTATSYDIRYSTSPITADTWAAATQVSGEPTPAVAGTAQSLTVSGLSAVTTYYFAIRAVDDGGNTAELSNVASTQTSIPQAELKLWLRADAGVTKDGSNLVSTWADQSGQGFNATASGTQQPLYVANALNGLPVMRFDGSDDNFALGSNYLFADSSKTGITFVAVVKSTADKTDNLAQLLDFGTAEAGGGGYAFHYDTNYAGVFWRKSGLADNGRVGYTHSKGSNFVIYTGIIKFGTAGNATNTVRLNGQQVGNATSSYALAQLTGTEIDESATRTWSSGPVSLAMQSKGIDATRNLQGDIAEVLCYSSAFTSTNARALEQYLATKYGITLD